MFVERITGLGTHGSGILDRPVSQQVRQACISASYVKFLVGGSVRTQCSPQVVLHGFHCCFPQSSKVWSMWWDEFPVTSFSG